MARIQTYNIDSLIEGSDKLVGTDGTIGLELNKTKNFTLGGIKAYTLDEPILTGIFEYTDNADAIANGLAIGAVYRTADLLKIVH
jgi:hypothetical protein